MGERLELLIVAGGPIGRRFEVAKGGIRLGRSSSNDIHIPDEELSRNHCLFEPVGERGIRVTDLASANGTSVNDADIGGKPTDLKAGDVVKAGSVELRVVESGSDKVDLGLGAKREEASEAGEAKRRRSPFANVLWAFAVLIVIAAVYLILSAPVKVSENRALPQPATSEVREIVYERVRADATGISRYALQLDANGAMKVRVDEVPGENRHHAGGRVLSKEALGRLSAIVGENRFRDFGRDDIGYGENPQELKTRSLKVVYSDRVRKFAATDENAPNDFRAICEELETFSKDEFGIWMVDCSREELERMFEEELAKGDAKWEDRDVSHGNLHSAIVAYRNAATYAEMLPRENKERARARLAKATAKLDEAYNRRRVDADLAINTRNWEKAREELNVLLEMIPDRDDERHLTASRKLMDVENRLKKGGR